jgi:dTDP-4-dehydrorhamnose 3,5-epimerase-like enzyme
MAAIIQLPEFTDSRGGLTVIDNIENLIPFPVKRIFYIYDVDDSVRGGHRHHATRQAAVCIRGKCIVSNNNGTEREDFLLDSPSKCLILETTDWHQMHHFTPDAVLLVFASTVFSPDDYIYEPYSNQ